jgi:hypothetical protein
MWVCDKARAFQQWRDDWWTIGLWCLSLLSKLLAIQNYPAQVKKVNVYFPSLRMKVPDHVYVFGSLLLQ